MDNTFRLTPPPSGDIKMPVIPSFTTQKLPNGAMLHVMPGGNQSIVKFEVCVSAGSLRCDRALVASATSELLTEGTQRHTAQEIAESLDFYGAYTWPASSIGRASLTSLCLERDLAPVLAIVNEILRQPTFPDEEVALYKAQELQNFDMKMMRTPFLASRAMLELLYESGSRYRRFALREDYDALTPEMLRTHHASSYRPNGAHIFVSGRPSDADIRLIAETFGSTDWEPGTDWEAPGPQYNPKPGRAMIEHDGEQTSVRISRPIFNREHPDLLPFQMANAAFGGYFGARLMQNLRERLGLTYGVYSTVNANKFRGVHTIATEVKTGSHKVVEKEIFNDMERLASEVITDREMETLRGFMMGEMLHFFDTIMTSADTVFTLLLDGVGTDYLSDFYRVARDITKEEVRDMAAKWFVPNEYSVVCVGKGVEE